MFDKITNSTSHINLILSNNGLAFEEYKKTIDMLGKKLDGSKKIHEAHFKERRVKIEEFIKKEEQVFLTTLFRDIAIEIIDCVKKMNLENNFCCFYLDRDEEGGGVTRQFDFDLAEVMLEYWDDNDPDRIV